MTPWEEVRATGGLGYEGAKLLYRLVYSVAIDRNFPPPHGYARWDQAAIEETAHDFLIGPAGNQRFVAIAHNSTSNDSFRRQLAGAVLNHLRELGRATDLGKLVVRLTDLLTTTDQFEMVERSGAPLWALRGGPTGANTVPVAQLEPHIRSMRVVRPKWSSETRDPPFARHDTLVEMVRRVLTAADGAMTARDLAQVVAARIDIRRIPLTYELDDPSTGLDSGAHADPDSDPADASADRAHALAIFGSLTDREKILVAFSDRTVREVGPLVGLRHAQAAIVRQRLVDRLRDDVADSDNPDATVEVLCELCDAWVVDQTDGDGATLRLVENTERGETR